MNLVAAATLPLNAQTAEQSLDLLGLNPGQTLLITGAAGGLGAFTVSLARERRLRIIATASASDETLVRSLGANFFIPREEDLAQAVHSIVPDGVDGVLDAAHAAEALAGVRDDGSFVAVNYPHTPETTRGIKVHTIQVLHDGKELSRLVKAVDDGKLSLRVAKTLPLAEAAEAHRLLEKGGTKGKIVLIP